MQFPALTIDKGMGCEDIRVALELGKDGLTIRLSKEAAVPAGTFQLPPNVIPFARPARPVPSPGLINTSPFPDLANMFPDLSNFTIT